MLNDNYVTVAVVGLRFGFRKAKRDEAYNGDTLQLCGRMTLRTKRIEQNVRTVTLTNIGLWRTQCSFGERSSTERQSRIVICFGGRDGKHQSGRT